MERLRKQDEEQGIERKPLTDAQKAEIAEIRSVYQAKIAELELRQEGNRWKTPDPAEQIKLEEDYRRDRDRLTSERDAKIERVRG
jgi:hypothetical protein